ncbi:MAG: carboxypeptidase-like regulatory domain-containing protein, partial [Acidilobaceae archaeon]|nr:carboxypeptidase-like regulatory domain-containing protein [Acidilobaceae archaeon]
MPKLTVIVLDSYYDYEVYGALVTVRAGNFKRFAKAHLDDPEGAVFENLEPGDYEIIVRDLYLPYIPYRGKVTLNEDKTIAVKLLRPIEVFVKDPNGNPIKNAIVRMVYVTHTCYDVLYDSLAPLELEYPVNQEGKVELLPLYVGSHFRIEASAPGYKESSITIPFFVNKERL